MFIPLLNGYIDIGCLIPATLSIILFINYNITKIDKSQIIRNSLISINLILSFISRRYFSFFIVGYVFALILVSFIPILVSKDKKKIISAIMNIGMIGLISLLILFVVFRKLFLHVISTNYSGMYVAYNASYKEKLLDLAKKYGFHIFVMAVIGALMPLTNKYENRKLVIFCGLSVFFSVISFFNVQKMGFQHIYIIAPQIIILSAIGFVELIVYEKNNFAKLSIQLFILLLFVTGTLYCYMPSIRKTFLYNTHIFPLTYNPKVRNDIDEIWDMVTYVNSQTGENNSSVYVLASAMALNTDIFPSLTKPGGSNPLNNQFTTADVDLRDGFPVSFFDSDYIITTIPIQTHLAEGTQEVIRFLAEEVMNENSVIGKHFSKCDRTFYLQNGVEAYVYRKISNLDKTDIQFVQNYFIEYYPNNNYIFRDRIESYLNQKY